MSIKKTIYKAALVLTIIMTVFLIAFFSNKDFRMYAAIRYKLFATLDPLCAYVYDIDINDDNIQIIIGLRQKRMIDFYEQYYSSLQSSVELNDFIFSLQESDFWCDKQKSVYISSNHYFGGGVPNLSLGTGYGTNGQPYSDGCISTISYDLQGKWIHFTNFDNDFKKRISDEMSEHDDYNIK